MPGALFLPRGSPREPQCEPDKPWEKFDVVRDKLAMPTSSRQEEIVMMASTGTQKKADPLDEGRLFLFCAIYVLRAEIIVIQAPLIVVLPLRLLGAWLSILDANPQWEHYFRTT